MKKLLLLLILAGAPASLFAQGVFSPPQTAFKNINGIVMPIANATITVCAANAGGIPCSPALVSTIFKDSALTQALANPFTADANGNYQFAAAAATYTVTVTAAGFAGNSYQVSLGSSSSGGGGNPTLDNCTPDQTGNSFFSVASLTNYFLASWQFIFNTTTYINCTVYVPTAQTGATLVLDIATSDSTAGHTATFQTCDGLITSGTINLASALTCAATQTFTTTSTAYNRVTLTFNVQSTLASGGILVVKIATSPTGTAPTANLLVYPHFIL